MLLWLPCLGMYQRARCAERKTERRSPARREMAPPSLMTRDKSHAARSVSAPMTMWPALLFFLASFSSATSLYGEELKGCGDNSSSSGPVFEEQPADTIYPEESSEGQLLLHCRARASPPAAYKWLLNGQEIKLLEEPDEHYSLVGGSLQIRQPDRSRHAGNYKCMALNEYGSIVSRDAVVRFGYLDPFSTEEREAVFVKEGQGAVLLCAPPPHHPAELSFRWMLNVFPIFIPLDKRRFVSQTTGNLYISKVDSTDSGNYSCFVSSPSISKSVFSKFIPLVPITERPIRKYPADIKVKYPDTYALVGQNVTLECFALGNPIPEVRWRKEDAEMPPRLQTSMAGALLHIPSVQLSDEGTYDCEALNSKGKDRHRTRLYVDAHPVWVEHIVTMEKDIGSELTMSCVATGKPKPHIRWLKNGEPHGRGELKFDRLALSDSAMYQCIAENKHGVIYANAQLYVMACSPSFEKNPVKKEILGAKNGRVVIECKPQAAPRARLSWTKGTELLSNTSRIRIWEDGSLEILNVSKVDEGKYSCFAENNRGKANSTGSLSITEATKITLAPSNADVQVGEDARMQCGASHDSSLDITFTWALDGHVIDFDREAEHYQRTSRESSSELHIRNTRLKHAGRYICTAQTIVDNISASADLFVRGPPGPPLGIHVEDIKEKSVKLLWSRGPDNHSPISKYTIQAREASSANPDEWKDVSTWPPNVEGNEETVTVVDLIPWTEYEFRVIATNTLGTGDPSSPSPRITTLEAIPVVAPSDIGGGGNISRELVITWTPVKREYYYGPNFGYIIAFKPHYDSEWRKVTLADPEARQYIHKDPALPANTEFQVKVKAFNNKGEGPYSLTAIIYSPQDVPLERPANVVARTLSATEAIVVWLSGTQPGIEGYQVKYWKKHDDSETANQKVQVPATENQTRLENLLPNSHYVIEVQAYNTAGFGPPSNRYEIHTKKAPPSRPPRIIKKSFSRSVVNIAWEHVEPLANESTIKGYKVVYRQEGDVDEVLYTATNEHSIDLPLPKKGYSVVEVRALSEGGDGAVAQVRISGGAMLSAQPLGLAALLTVALCCLGL
uniref:Contactin-1a-like n=1 Tax=Paramormyrops kingsleyae TaxID=1676925 RepID=A0A3B3SPJ3_9TELE|nr:contactin-1a-like isoform X1 [Paramormyrops kingsleyae]